MRNSRIAAIAVLVAAAILLAAVVVYDATLPTVALGLPVQGGEGTVAVAGLGTALAAIAFGARGLWRAHRGQCAAA